MSRVTSSDCRFFNKCGSVTVLLFLITMAGRKLQREAVYRVQMSKSKLELGNSRTIYLLELSILSVVPSIPSHKPLTQNAIKSISEILVEDGVDYGVEGAITVSKPPED